MKKDRLVVFDTTLRDGEQVPTLGARELRAAVLCALFFLCASVCSCVCVTSFGRACFQTPNPLLRQSPGCSMNTQEKVAIAHQLSRLGVDVCEVPVTREARRIQSME